MTLKVVFLDRFGEAGLPNMSATKRKLGDLDDAGDPPVKKQRGTSPARLSDNDEESAAILRVISQHAEHRGPREAGVTASRPADNLARRYLRGRNWKDTAQVNAQPSQPIPAHLQIPLSSQYICHMCGEKGHHIKLCPKRQGRKQSKKIRTATGIPRSWLRPIAPEDINQHEDVYCLSNGQLAVLKTANDPQGLGDNGSSFRTPSILASKSEDVTRLNSTPHVDEALMEDLKCQLCGHIFRNAHLVSCCGMTYCGACIDMYIESHGSCPKCKSNLTKSDVAPNDSVQESLEALSVVSGPSGDTRTEQTMGKQTNNSSHQKNHQP
eukprot:Blabericola_migrator_1__8941@NODE_4740_length_999_cov_93_131974_g2950_i0_p1_GENE_NODE_4740_length_999_cov_93_131974_g2950_i0NODE_4740_length_999_cov_93_131974_g2950_i0_p1_ORF_typecomplete_len324_score38_46zfCCHC_2/PF13696_6/2_1e08zfCCHC_2/PF13696_6/3_7e03Ubox/PF04564_15/3_9e07zfRING_6/PF14835_6/1_1e05zfC3HC4_2/PF13923_6/1_1e05zfC3HC4_3/PF13920_6/1_7e03zfC3HC4_3/PF13920_6/0_0003Baculo_IE1/PF05290_11/1_1e04Baculo_IE1/PF05290_11/0_0034zfC3HC4/PF00097_25/0_011zfC2HE/PF16278_5/14zfC2HE/PF16278_5/4_2z